MFRFLKRFFLSLVSILLIVAAVLWATGNEYLLKGFRHTYLVGKTTPDITDLNIFPYRTITTSDALFWENDSTYNTDVLLQEEQQYLDSIETASFLVIQNGKIVFENYWESFSDTTPTNAFSMAKSIVGLLVGIALDEGKITSLDEPIENYLPEYKNSGISIRHLLWMSSGLNWKESGRNPFSDNAKAYYGSDLKNLILGQKRITPAGKIFDYMSGNSALLALIVERSTGKNISEYAEEKLWKPLRAEQNAYWSLDHEHGFEKAYCCVYAIPRDFAKIGQLVLNKGQWNGQQIISENYLQESFTPAPILEEDGASNTRYGLHWWMGTLDGEFFYNAQGILGQYIIILPESNMVIVRTGRKRDKVEHNGLPIDIYRYIRIAKRMTSN
jgi:CubicO group peptidase (beta-lactamase class C family)